MAKMRLWLLNRALDYDRAYLRDQLEADLIPILTVDDKHEVKFGDRNKAGINRADIHSRLAELMHERDINEYFVPIPVKCLGAPGRLTPLLTQAGATQVAAIQASYPEYFKDEHAWKRYWTHDVDPARRVRMATVDGMGLYEAMLASSDDDEQHVLVGYSQGGLVARYLAYIDGLAKKQRIAGVITVHAPNYGSPLGRDDNADSVAIALLQVAASLARMPPGKFPLLGEEIASGLVAAGHLNLDRVVGVLGRAIADYQNLDEDDRESRAGLFEFLTTAHKWLSGLRADNALAFADLNIERLARDHSVLKLVNDNVPTHAFYGAIVGANWHLTDFAKSMLQGFWLQAAFWLKQGDLRPVLVDAQRVYKTVAMTETRAGLPPVARVKADQYKDGIDEGSAEFGQLKLDRPIHPHAHDFIIPSVYQVVPPPEPEHEDRLLGNFVNDEAAHISGASLDYEGGKTNQELIGRMLAKIAKRVA